METTNGPEKAPAAHEVSCLPRLDLLQTGVREVLQRQTIDRDTCDDAEAESFRGTHDEAIDWVDYAVDHMHRPRIVRGLLWNHFRVRPDDPALATVRENFDHILNALQGSTNTYHCEPDETCRVVVGEDTNGNPMYQGAHAGDRDITFCHSSLDLPLPSRAKMLIHETAHTAPPDLPDGPYASQEGYPGATPVNNAETYSEFATRLQHVRRVSLSSPLGVLVNGDEAQFAFGVALQVIPARRLFWGMDVTTGLAFQMDESGAIIGVFRAGLQREFARPGITVGAWTSVGVGAERTETGLAPITVIGGGAEVQWRAFEDLGIGVSFEYLRSFLSEETDPNRFVLSGNLSWSFE